MKQIWQMYYVNKCYKNKMLKVCKNKFLPKWFIDFYVF